MTPAPVAGVAPNRDEVVIAAIFGRPDRAERECQITARGWA
jgi:hypothetical protein